MFDSVESWSKEMWSLSYITLLINIPVLKLSIIIIVLHTNQPEKILPTGHTTKN